MTFWTIQRYLEITWTNWHRQKRLKPVPVCKCFVRCLLVVKWKITDLKFYLVSAIGVLTGDTIKILQILICWYISTKLETPMRTALRWGKSLWLSKIRVEIIGRLSRWTMFTFRSRRLQLLVFIHLRIVTCLKGKTNDVWGGYVFRRQNSNILRHFLFSGTICTILLPYVKITYTKI